MKKDKRKSQSPLRVGNFDEICDLGFRDLIRALDSQASHTSFGVLPLSIEQTAPNYSKDFTNEII